MSSRVEPRRAASSRVEPRQAPSSRVEVPQAASNRVACLGTEFFPRFHAKIWFYSVFLCVSLIMHRLINYSYHDTDHILQPLKNPHTKFHHCSTGVSPPTYFFFHSHFRENLIFWIFWPTLTLFFGVKMQKYRKSETKLMFANLIVFPNIKSDFLV